MGKASKFRGETAFSRRKGGEGNSFSRLKHGKNRKKKGGAEPQETNQGKGKVVRAEAKERLNNPDRE